MKPLVSIIIPTLDEAHMILPTLDAIAANGTPHEVIVVDGGSLDKTDELAERSRVRLVRATERNRLLWRGSPMQFASVRLLEEPLRGGIRPGL